MHVRLLHVVAVVAAALALGGCVAADPEAVETPSDAPTPSATPTPEPSETPSAVPTPTKPVGTPITPQDAYTGCYAIVSQAQYPDRPVTPAPFEDADVILRSDGLYYVYTEVTVTDASTASQRDVAYECIVGGTLEAPEYYLYGAVARSPLSQRDPEMPFSA